jgi:hypothetical protein
MTFVGAAAISTAAVLVIVVALGALIVLAVGCGLLVAAGRASPSRGDERALAHAMAGEDDGEVRRARRKQRRRSVRAGTARGPADAEIVATWRYRQLLALGADPLTAAAATLAGVDAGEVRSLVERGCPVQLALAIREPDDVTSVR